MTIINWVCKLLIYTLHFAGTVFSACKYRSRFGRKHVFTSEKPANLSSVSILEHVWMYIPDNLYIFIGRNGNYALTLQC